MAGPLTAFASDRTLSACDECRIRKLKCSGDLISCSRCTAEDVLCHYSQRKTMGRPRKRRRDENGDIHDGKAGQGCIQDRDHNQGGRAGQYEHFVGTSGDSLANNDIPYLDNDVEASAFPDLNFDIQSVQELGLVTAFGTLPWDELQDPSIHASRSSSNSLQSWLPTAPATLNQNSAYNAAPVETISTCTCLPNLYAALASFQSMPAPSFPYSMGTLKKANRLGQELVKCQVCPQTYNTAIQNSMLLGTLLQMVINEYAKLLKYIDEKSTLDDRIIFRVGEPSSQFDIRHTGTPDCPMAINVELSGDDWRMLARKAIRQEVLGSTDSNGGLEGLVDALRNRQIIWHERYMPNLKVTKQDSLTGINKEDGDKADKMCLQVAFVDQLKKSLEMLKLRAD